MSELSQIAESVAYIRGKVDEIAINGCSKAAAHDQVGEQVKGLMDERNRLKGALWAIGLLVPPVSGVIALLVSRSEAVTAKQIVEQVLAKLTNGG